MELPNILTIVREFDDRGAGRDGYPERRPAPPRSWPRSAGATSRRPRRCARGRERFTDKLPNNFSHVG